MKTQNGIVRKFTAVSDLAVPVLFSAELI